MRPNPSYQGTRGYWDSWTAQNERVGGGTDPRYYYYKNHAFLRRLYLRLLPEEFELTRWGGRIPTVFELWVVNDSYIVYIKPLYLENNAFPIGMSDLGNDGFGYAAKTEVELFWPFQYATSALLNAGVMGAMRAVDDRAIYDPRFLNVANLTKKSGSAYIPMTHSLAQDRDIRSIYHSVPFDPSVAYSMPGLIRELVGTTQMLRGRNNFAQGLPQKGNRTLGEFSEVMQNADNRQAMQAIQLESDMFTEVKRLLKQHIAQFAAPTTLLNHKTKQAVQIDPQTIADLEYEFQLATGYFSKRTLANTDAITEFFRILQGDDQLRQQFDIAGVVSHIMALEGVKDLDQFRVGQPAATGAVPVPGPIAAGPTGPNGTVAAPAAPIPGPAGPAGPAGPIPGVV
jgi:hypothetical protein